MRTRRDDWGTRYTGSNENPHENDNKTDAGEDFHLRRLKNISLLWSFSAIVPAPTGHFSKPQPADVDIVLENTVYADGSPSPRLAARLDRAISIGHTNLFFVSGGNGECGTGEALAMHCYLVRCGVPSNNIVVSGAGNDTWSTARNASAFAMILLRQDQRIKAGLKIRRMLARAMSR